MKKQRKRTKMDTSKIKKKLITFVVGIGVLLGVVSAAKYDNPKELIDNKYKQDKDATIEEPLETKQASSSVANKIPAIIKSLLLLPLWIIGSLILNLLDKAIKLVGAPFLSFLLSVLFLFLILLFIVVSVIKFLCPELTLKQILNKKLVISVLVSSFVMVCLDRLFLNLFDSYENIRRLIRFVLGLLVILFLVLDVIKSRIIEERKSKGIYVES